MSFHPISTKGQSRLHQFVTQKLPVIFIGYGLNSGEGWTGDFIISDGHDIVNYITSEVHVKRFKSKEEECTTCNKYLYFLAHTVLRDKKVTHNVTPHATRESRASTRRQYPLLWARRSATLCSAQGVTLCRKKVEFQIFLKLIATLWKPGKVSGVCPENLLTATTLCPANSGTYRQSHDFQLL